VAEGVERLDDLRGVIDRACEAVSKGDSPESIAAYIWSNVPAHLEAQRDQARQEVLEEVAAEFSQRSEDLLALSLRSDEERGALNAYDEAAAHCRSLATLDPSGEESVEQCKPCEGTGRRFFVGRAGISEPCPRCNGTGKKPVPHPSGEQGEEERNWLIGPGGDGARVLDGPAVEENIAVIPELHLLAAEEALLGIAKGSEPDGKVLSAASPSYRLWDRVKIAHQYFEGRTVWMVQAPATDTSKEVRDGDEAIASGVATVAVGSFEAQISKLKAELAAGLSIDEARTRLLDAMEKARQGSVGPGNCINFGDLAGGREVLEEVVQVVALEDFNAALDQAFPASSKEVQGDGE
jgi:hypothetical protein